MVKPVLSLVLAAALVLAMPAAAQSAGDVALGKRLYQEKATCSECHGWAGNGVGDPFSPGKAANLRQSQLDHDRLFEIIRCGVPGGTAMPHFERFAWTEGEDCFGMTGAEIGEKEPPAPTVWLQKREIEAIVSYLQAKVIGKGPPTVADCEEYFGAGSTRCREMAAGRKE